jgi:hypothetical protein
MIGEAEMKAKDSPSFPLYHRIGQVARPIIASRYWIVTVLIVAILLYSPFLFSGFFQDDYGFHLQFSPEIFAKGNVPEEIMQNGPLILYLVVSPATVLFNPISTQMQAKDQASAADFGSAPELAEQHIYVINPPGAMSFMGGLFQRLFTDKPFPQSLNYLSSGFAPVHIERVDARTIVVTPEGGYTPLPGPIVDDATGVITHVHLENIYRVLDGFYYNPRNPMQVGQLVVLREVTVEVTEMTGDGRIAQAAFTFAHPLEGNRYVWLLWNQVTLTYERVQMPSVGETVVYP